MRVTTTFPLEATTPSLVKWNQTLRDLCFSVNKILSCKNLAVSEIQYTHLIWKGQEDMITLQEWRDGNRKASSLDELLAIFPVSMVSPNITDIYMSVKKLQCCSWRCFVFYWLHDSCSFSCCQAPFVKTEINSNYSFCILHPKCAHRESFIAISSQNHKYVA